MKIAACISLITNLPMIYYGYLLLLLLFVVRGLLLLFIVNGYCDLLSGASTNH